MGGLALFKTKLSLYTSAKASVLGAAWSLLPSCADDLDVAWNLPRCLVLLTWMLLGTFLLTLGVPWMLLGTFLLPFLYPSYCAEEACDKTLLFPRLRPRLGES